MLASIRRNPSTTITAFFAAVLVITPMVNDLQDIATPLNIPEEVWFYPGAGLGVLGVFGKMWQALYPALQKVTWRWPSIIGFAVAAVAILTPFLTDLADASAPFNLPPSTFLVIGSVFAAVTYLGRVLQAVGPFQGTRKTVPADDIIVKDPNVMVLPEATPETEATPDAWTAPAIHPDSAEIVVDETETGVDGVY